jgi:branched-chain amino acid transport system substrate-binding protein
MADNGIRGARRGRTSRRNLVRGVAVLAAASLLAACGGDDGADTASGDGGGGSDEPIKIGMVSALTGPVAAYGVQTVNAFQLAARDINEAGGIMGRQVEVEVVDNQSKPDAVPSLMRQLASDGACLLLGASSSPVTIVAAGAADQLKVPLIVPMEAADAIIGEGREWVFKVAPSVLAENGWPAQTIRATMAAAEESGVQPQTALIIAASTGAYPEAVQAWTRTLQEEYPEVKLIDTISVDEATTTDFAPLVSQARSLDPDLLIFGGNPQSAFLFYPALERSGWDPMATVGVLGGNTNTKFIESVGPAAAELDIAGNYWTPNLKGEGEFTPQRFFDDYTAEYGDEPDGVGAYYYATMGLVADAITAADGNCEDPEAIRDALRETEIDGISGDDTGMFIVNHGVNFNDKGLNDEAVGLVTQIQDGEYIPVFPEDVALAPIVFPRPGHQ